MKALGRLFNVLPVADDVYVDLSKAGGVTFIGVLTTGDTWTISEAKDAAGTSAAVLTTVTDYHYTVTVGSAWVAATLAANSAVTTTSAQDVICIEIEAAELSDGFEWVKCASTSTGIVIAIQRDLVAPRKPANLPAMV